MTSRATMELTRPMPIFQLKPSGRMTGSMKWPMRPMTLVARSEDLRDPRDEVHGQHAEHPDQEADREDDGAGLLQEKHAAVIEPQAERAHGGPAILRQLQDERCR